MARRLLAASLLVSMTILGAVCSPAGAQEQCGPHGSVLRQLAEKYGETVVAAGITSDGAMLEIVATPSGSTWSAVVRLPDGTACLVAAGENWRSAPATVPGQES